jgi:hypothetical protein
MRIRCTRFAVEKQARIAAYRREQEAFDRRAAHPAPLLVKYC